MNTEILNLILETLHEMEKKNKVYEDLIETLTFRISELEYSENQLKKKAQAQAEKIEHLENDLSEKIQEDIDDLLLNSMTIVELEAKIEGFEDSIYTLENIDIEDELRNSCYFTELEEKITELEEPQGYVSDIGDKSFVESNREELDGLNERIRELEAIIKSIGKALNK